MQNVITDLRDIHVTNLKFKMPYIQFPNISLVIEGDSSSIIFFLPFGIGVRDNAKFLK